MMMLLFPNEIFNLLKPADNQRIEQTFRKLVVLNVVGSNPTSHQKKSSAAMLGIFCFILLKKAWRNKKNITFCLFLLKNCYICGELANKKQRKDNIKATLSNRFI